MNHVTPVSPRKKVKHSDETHSKDRIIKREETKVREHKSKLDTCSAQSAKCIADNKKLKASPEEERIARSIDSEAPDRNATKGERCCNLSRNVSQCTEKHRKRAVILQAHTGGVVN